MGDDLYDKYPIGTRVVVATIFSVIAIAVFGVVGLGVAALIWYTTFFWY